MLPPLPPRHVTVPLLAAALALAYLAGRLLPALGHDGHLAVQWWGSFLIYAAASALCLTAARRTAEDRQAWSLLGLGILLFGLGSVASFASSNAPDDPPLLAWIGWLAFYPLAYAALLAMLRARLRPFTLSLILDGVLGGLTLMTVCAALLRHDLASQPAAKVVAGLALPTGDLILLSMLLWACAMAGRRGGQWLWLAGAMVLAAVAHVAQDLAVLNGTFDPLDATTACYPLTMLAIGVAAWRPAPPPRPVLARTLAFVLAPMACVLSVIVVLVFVDAGDAITEGLAIAALAVAFGRAALTFQELSQLHEARRFARGFEEATIGMAFVSSTELTWIRVNATLATMLGRSPEELVGRPIAEVIHPSEVDASRGLHETVRAGETPAPYVRRALRPDGTVVDLAISIAVVESDDGQRQMFSQVQDVTEARRIARHNGALVDLSRVALEVHDPAELLEQVTALLCSALPADEVALTDGATAGADDDPRLLGVRMDRRANVPAMLLARRGTEHPPFAAAHERFLEAAANVLGTALDRAAVEDELRTQALEDPLTGLANRSYLAAHVEQAIAGADRGDTIAVLLLDLDRFKVVNDTLGHGAGDELLCAVADRLRSTIRRGDLAARLGGDEFVVVCAGAGGAPHEVAALSQRLLATIAAPYVVDGRELHISASAGLVFVEDADATAESLLRDADVAMYRAKEHGGARYEVFDAGLRARVVQRLAIEGELRHALARDELLLHLQPVVDLHRDELAGFEALVRWEHPTRGLVGPNEFIGVAEETGLIVPIGGWVLTEATRQLAILQEAAGRPLRISVNLSARQLTPGLVDAVGEALTTASLQPRQLTLEVTETLLVDGPGAVEVLAAVRALGVAIAIDDFGTGWSSLGSLQRYPVDILKLDRSLVVPAAESGPAAALARAVVEMAQALGLDVIAEGMENDAQLNAMKALGCPHGQGYVLARPMPLDAALELVARRPTGRAANAPVG